MNGMRYRALNGASESAPNRSNPDEYPQGSTDHPDAKLVVSMEESVTRREVWTWETGRLRGTHDSKDATAL